MRNDSLDGRLMLGNFTQIFYQYDVDLDNLPDTLPNGMILLRSEFNGVDSLDVFYKWMPIPKSTHFQAMEIKTTQAPVTAPKHHIEIYSHSAVAKPLQWEQSGSMLSYCGFSLGLAVWLGCVAVKVFNLSPFSVR
jgi:hypothetical protein